jgi:diguanylate cyclase (GGDEF)-like protein
MSMCSTTDNPERKTAWRPLARLALLLAVLMAAPAQAVPLVVERLDGDPGIAAVADILAGRHDADFVGEDYAAITPSRQRGGWYRVRLASDWSQPVPPVISVFDPQGLRARAYLPPDYAEQARSIYDEGNDIGFTRHALVFMLPVTLRADQPFLLYVAPDREVPRRIAVESVTDARKADLARARLDVLFPAIQLATLLVMLSFFLALRERMYAYFAMSELLIVMYELYAFGIGYEMPPFNVLAPFGVRGAWATAACAVVMLVEFSRQYLELARVAPLLDRLLAMLRVPLLVLSACALLPPLAQQAWVEDLLTFVLLVAAPLLFVSGMVAWQRGGRRGGYFLCAWIPGLLLIIARMLQLALHWPLPAWLEFALPGAFAFASLVLSFGLAEQTLSVRHERDVAHRLAEQDMLTGVLNRRAVLARLRSCFLSARADRTALAVLFLDLDHFKHINDNYGHRTGDHCLRAVIAPIAAELRLGDAFGRWGGEEFLVILPGADAQDAQAVAERIRACIEALPLMVSGTRIGLTLSIGIAALDEGAATPEQLIEGADIALYRAKADGRNRVCTFHRGETAVDPGSTAA